MTRYIRIEAVNIYPSIADTDHISIIRGGSLLLKQAIDDIEERCKTSITAISTGASIGLFKVNDESEIDIIKPGIIQFLNDTEIYRYFTFVVADAQGDDFQRVKEILIAKCRTLQLKQISLSGDYQQSAKPAQPCAIEGIRRAYDVADFPDNQKIITNAFAKLKLVYGREQRNKLYKDELSALAESSPTCEYEKIPALEKLKKLKFTSDLSELSTASEFKNLNGKIAVIYFDGNGFSKIQNELVLTADQQIEFDDQIKILLRLFLYNLLEHCNKDSSWLNKDKLRLETLLWGGDEMLFVVPAWKGFEFLNFFYKTSQSWTITIGGKSKQLSHAGGIVFCQQNTPIFKMRSLAQQLAERIKNHATGEGRKANYYDYLVLESIDYPAEKLDRFFSHRYGDLATYRTYLSAQTLVDTPWIGLTELSQIVPKSQIYALALAARQITITTETGTENLIIDQYQDFEKILKRLYLLSKDSAQVETLETQLSELETMLFPQTSYHLSSAPEHNKFLQDDDRRLTKDVIKQALMWLHLVQCWDYLWPEAQ